MQFKPASKKDITALVEMGLLLWPKESKAGLEKEFSKYLKQKNQKIIICFDKKEYAGFIHTSIRKEYVEGAKTSPVGYIEGIFVYEKYRKKGIAKELVKLGEIWAKGKGCKEMGSDTETENKKSIAFHTSLGFSSEEVVIFIKKI